MQKGIFETQMEKDQTLRETPCSQDALFPISIFLDEYQKAGSIFLNHWHDHIEFLYVKSGEGIFECEHVAHHVKPGSLILVNSGELHCGYSLTDTISYYCIIIDPAMIQSGLMDVCNVKYIAPITQNMIIFENRLDEDVDILACINGIVTEYEKKSIGFEFSIKSDIYRVLVLLLRSHVHKMLTADENEIRKREMVRFSPIFQHIESNYAAKINSNQLAQMANISLYHFSRIFKSITGMTVTEYVNSVRLRHAADLLIDSDMNVTEIALATGFNDLNYFTRQFRKHMHICPSKFKAGNRKAT